MSTSPSSPPRAIQGCVGSRVRVIFGDTASEYLIVLDHDDGDREWQTHHWDMIPRFLGNQINNCDKKGRYITQVDFDGASIAWFLQGRKRDGSGGHSWWNDVNDCSDHIEDAVSSNSKIQVALGSKESLYDEREIVNVIVYGSNGYSTRNLGVDLSLRDALDDIRDQRSNVQMIRLFDDDQYYIKYDGGSTWLIRSEHVRNELKEQGRSNVFDVAIAKDGCWLIASRTAYAASTGVPSEVKSILDNFYADQKARNSKRGKEIQAYHMRRREEAAERRREAEEAERQRQQEEEDGRRRAQEQEARIQREAEEARVRREQDELARQAEEQQRLFREEEARLLRQAEEQQKEDALLEEAAEIKHMYNRIDNRKRALLDSASSLPPARRARIAARTSPHTAEADVSSLTPARSSDGQCIQAEVSPSSTSNSDVRRSDCVVCHEEQATLAIIPCGHVCLCSDCSTKLAQGPTMPRGTCPICRRPVESTLKVFLQ